MIPRIARAFGTGIGSRLVFLICAHLIAFVPQPSWAAVEKKPVVFTKIVNSTELSETLAYPARVEPRIRASVIAETDGVVSKIIAPLGSRIQARKPLLVIKNTDPIYQYSPMVVTSAVDGVVSRVEVTEGSRVSRGDKLLMVTDPDQVRVTVEVTAFDLREIKPGMLAELKVPGIDNPVMLQVKGASPFVDPATGTASCELELAKKKGAENRMPPLGMIGRVYFRVNVRKGISVSDNAITYRGKDPFIRIVESGKARLVSVVLGRKESGTVEVLKGLKAGDQIIERANGFVADGESVDVQSADPEKQAAQPGTEGKG